VTSEKEAQLLKVEQELLTQTDNGWQEADPEEQPDNPDPWPVEED
jgi:hypothetical protein